MKFSVTSRKRTPAKATNIKAFYGVARALAATKNALSFRANVTHGPAQDPTMRNRLDPAPELQKG
jgi:hypothetical protein